MLDECHYCPSFLMNVISVSFLVKFDFKFLINNNFCDIIMNDTTIMCRQLKHSIYILSQYVGVMYISNKHPRIDNVSDFYLWHCRLDHVNKNRIDRLIKEGVLEINDLNHYRLVNPIYLVR